mgnify:CR=1 FL=1
MNIIFFGNSYFTAEAVKLLLKYKDVMLTLVSYKDCPDYCVSRSLNTFYKNTNFNYIEFDRKIDDVSKILEASEYDVLISCAWNTKFPDAILKQLPCYNIHPSLLPKYRGATPLHSQLEQGEKRSGITMHLMTQNYDCGPIYRQLSFKISPKDTLDRIVEKAAKKMCVILKHFVHDFPDIKLTPQNDDEATYC